QFVYNQELTESGLTLGATFGYTAYLPHHITRRLPASGYDSISQDKEELYETVRHLLGTTAGVEQKVEKYGLAFSGGYSLLYLSKVNYQPGLLAQGERLEWLSNLLPSETLHSVLISAAFS